MNDPFAHPASTNITSNIVPHSAERSQSTNNNNNNNNNKNNNTTPASSKWIRNDTADREVDQVGLVAHNRADSQLGGNKLRAPRTLANEEEFLLGDKKRTVVKRRRRELDEELSDTEEDDPYRKINIEDILSPIEYPTDIVRRPALKRIIKSPQIEELSNTAMEFIEGEKNFCKVLSRLSAILHHDDPQYLDLNFERTPEQRQKAVTNNETITGVEGENKQKEQSSTDENNDIKTTQEDNKQNGLDGTTDKAKTEENGDEIIHQDNSEDTEAQEVVRNVRELLLENINFSNEYLWRLQGARSKLVKANMQKENLWQQLKASAKGSKRHARHS
ncbi:hypothetical protein INT45_005453 [Circinella minor]|uniref:Transcriptional regulatory protein RXT2 N-terminal domain-containing protein n=1 Tax=Circinella minor TaxID=1195481 RepID=A0A8H7RZQ0_9FUNG|nr:hypothetical protein INT45_005453 [Circinella minor]